MGPALPDMPWEERPRGEKRLCGAILPTRSSGATRFRPPTRSSIRRSCRLRRERYNYAGVFRCDDTNRRMRIHAGFSVDGIDWDIREEDFNLVGGDAEISEWVYGYDPRVAQIGDKYYVTWCNGYHGPTIGVAWTEDFRDVPPAGKRLHPVQSQRRAVPPQDRQEIRDAFASERQRAYGVRRHFLFRVPRHGVLGRHPPRDVARGVRGFGLAVHEDRRGARAHRDQRRVAVVLPRSAPFVQRLRLCVRLGIARPG